MTGRARLLSAGHGSVGDVCVAGSNTYAFLAGLFLRNRPDLAFCRDLQIGHSALHIILRRRQSPRDAMQRRCIAHRFFHAEVVELVAVHVLISIHLVVASIHPRADADIIELGLLPDASEAGTASEERTHRLGGRLGLFGEQSILCGIQLLTIVDVLEHYQRRRQHRTPHEPRRDQKKQNSASRRRRRDARHAPYHAEPCIVPCRTGGPSARAQPRATRVAHIVETINGETAQHVVVEVRPVLVFFPIRVVFAVL